MGWREPLELVFTTLRGNFSAVELPAGTVTRNGPRGPVGDGGGGGGRVRAGSGPKGPGLSGLAGLTLMMSGLRSMLSRTKPSRSFSVPGPASAKVIGRRRGPALPHAMAGGGRSRAGGLAAVIVLVPGECRRCRCRCRGSLGRPGADAGADPGSLRPRCRCRASPTELAARAAASVSKATGGAPLWRLRPGPLPPPERMVRGAGRGGPAARRDTRWR